MSQNDQITALTRGANLPLAPVGQDVIAIVLEAIAQAWNHVKGHYPTQLQRSTEAEISALLVSRLNESLGWDSVLSLLVCCVDRGSETITFDGGKIETRPDLQFSLTMQDKRFRLIAECKIIDVPNRKTPALYRSKGIARFVRGDYAWASREAIMVGYVRCGAKLHPDLLAGLSQFVTMNCTIQTLVSAVKPPIAAGALGTSTHDRKFTYVHTRTAAPGAIELWHLWLDA